MKEELNIAAILKEKPACTKLWSPIIGECAYSNYYPSTEEIVVNFTNRYEEESDWNFHQSGRTLSAQGTAEVCLFPSKSMRDWSKFAWKKGDALTDNISTICLFDGWANDDYTEFKAKYTLHLISSNNAESEVCKTNNFVSVIKDEDKQSYLTTAEMFFNVNLTKGSLEIEKPEFKDGDIVFSEDNREIAIFKRTHKGIFDYHVCWSEGSNMCYDISSIDMNLRPATDSEKQQLFDALAKEGKRWSPDTLQVEDLPKKCEFKAFDKVLVRNAYSDRWSPAFFSNYNKNSIDGHLYGIIGGGYAYYKECITYNDQTAHLLGTTDDYKQE